MAIKIHNVRPKTSGLTPTDFSVARDRPTPIKKSVIVKHCLETATIPCVKVFGIFKYVFITMAKINKKINHGINTLSPFDLK